MKFLSKTSTIAILAIAILAIVGYLAWNSSQSAKETPQLEEKAAA